jgi:hypothetical protein
MVAVRKSKNGEFLVKKLSEIFLLNRLSFSK